MTSPPPLITFRSEPAVTVVSHAERLAAGLDHWVDGTMGILRHNGSTLVVAPNGPKLARHDLSSGGFVGGLLDASQPILGTRSRLDHASGGALVRDPETGTIVMVYHGERFTDGDWLRFYSFIGLAASDDGGETFVDLGPVVRSHVVEDDSAHDRPVELGPGGLVRRNGHFYLYFIDRALFTPRVRLGVARAPVDEVFAAASRGEAASFHKFHEGGFEQAGLGGSATDLLGDTQWNVMWLDVAAIPEHDLALLVFSTVSGDRLWQHYGCCSRDGLTWSEPQPITESGDRAEMLYLTIDSGDADQRTIEGHTFDLYRVVAEADFRWDDARLERLAVSWALG